MFTQDCIRAYPHAASAWSVLIVAITDRMFAFYEQARISKKAHDQLASTISSTTIVDRSKMIDDTMRSRSRYIKVPIIITDTDRFVGQRTSSTGSL